MATYKTHLTEKELLQSQEMSHEIWSGGKSLDERFLTLQKRLAYANGSLLSMAGIVDDKGIVLTSMKQYYSKLVFKGQPLNAIGLGAIFTNEKHRKAGWAKKLISMMLEEAQEEGYDCAYLFTDIGDKYYTQFGFAPLASLDFRTTIDFLPEQTTLEGRESSPKDTDTLLALYKERWAGDTLRMSRDKTYWDFFKDLNTSSPPFILSSKGKDIGYLSFAGNGEKVWLDECIIDPTLENEALGFLKNYMQSHGLKTIEGWHHPQQFTSLTKEVLPRKKASPMVCFFKGKPEGWSPDKSWFSSFDHF